MKLKAIVLASSLILTTSVAMANVTQGGFYVSGFAGWSKSAEPNASDLAVLGETPDKTDHPFTWGGTIGYNAPLASGFLGGFELSYIDFNNAKYSYGSGLFNTLEYDNYGIQGMFTGTFLLSNNFNVFAKIGGIVETSSVGVQSGFYNLEAPTNVSKTEMLPAVAVGVGYAINSSLEAALQYEHVAGADWSNNANPSNPMTQDAVTLNISYYFN